MTVSRVGCDRGRGPVPTTAAAWTTHPLPWWEQLLAIVLHTARHEQAAAVAGSIAALVDSAGGPPVAGQRPWRRLPALWAVCRPWNGVVTPS